MSKQSDTIFKISGSALSFLYYECDKSRTDQVGFLIGEKHLYIRKMISDSDLNGEKNETVININACLTVGVPFLFCNNIGRIDKAKLKEILGPLEKDVCGWFTFRRNSGLDPTLRTTILHRELLNALPHVTPDSFVLCCLGSDSNTSRSTHRFRHIFLLIGNRGFEPISVPITNLGLPQDIGYRTISVTNSPSSSANDIIHSLKLDKNTGGLSVMKSLQKPLHEKIIQLAAQVQQHDQMAQKLVNEINKIKNKNYKKSLIEQYNQINSNVSSPDGGSDAKKCQFSEEENEDDCVQEGGERTQLTVQDETKEKAKGSEDSEEIVYSSQKKQVETSPRDARQSPVAKNNTENSDLSQSLKFEQSEEY